MRSDESMAGKRIIAICISGGEFQTEKDGSLKYKGGEAHAIDVDDQTKFKDFLIEISEMFNCDVEAISVKYFLPGNRKTLISISNDKDLNRMIKFHGNFDTADVYVLMDEVVPEVSNMPASRSSRTTLSEAITPILPLDVVDDIMDDATQPELPMAAPPHLGVVDDDSTQISLPTGMLPDLPQAHPAIEKKGRGALQWQNTITGVGQRFNSVGEFRESLRKYAIAKQFAFRYKKNDSHRVTVKCKAEGCPWRIHASRLSTTQLICIKKMNPTHTCEGAGATNGHQASRSWVASIIKEKLQVFPNYKPKDIVNDIKQEYGIELNYFQAWRGKEIAKEQLQGSYKEAYKQLPFYCEKIMETNPGSVATFTTKEDSSFQRLFLSFHASIYGFVQGCRPLLFLDSVPVKSKYQGMLLTATSVDGDDGVFPVAFAVVDVENKDNWHWFLLQLKSALGTAYSVTFVADRDKGLCESLSEIFEDSFHGYCLRYLAEQFIRDQNGPISHEVKQVMLEDFYAAAFATRPESFHRCCESIKSISLEAYNWILQNSQPDHWANAFFHGARYNHMTSNFGEQFYSWASEANELPITQMVDLIRSKIMELMYTRRQDAEAWVSRLTPSMEDRIEKKNLKGHSLQVALMAENTFQVGENSFEVVDMNQCECSCKEWQLLSLPCAHAIAVINCLGRSPYEFCSRYFSVENYRLTYSQCVHPVPSVDRFMESDASLGMLVTVMPPPTRRPPGRPATKKMSSQEIVKRPLQCSRCKGIGHNKSTCKHYL